MLTPCDSDVNPLASHNAVNIQLTIFSIEEEFEETKNFAAKLNGCHACSNIMSTSSKIANPMKVAEQTTNQSTNHKPAQFININHTAQLGNIKSFCILAELNKKCTNSNFIVDTSDLMSHHVTCVCVCVSLSLSLYVCMYLYTVYKLADYVGKININSSSFMYKSRTAVCKHAASAKPLFTYCEINTREDTSPSSAISTEMHNPQASPFAIMQAGINSAVQAGK
jgi:hypothetical protein